MEEMIKNCVCQGFEEQLRAWSAMEDNTIEMEAFASNREKLFRKIRRKQAVGQLGKTIISSAAVIGILIVMLRPQYVAEACQKLIEWFQNYAGFQVMRTITGESIPQYVVKYVPGGYELYEEEYDEISGTQIYENGESRLYFIYSFSDANLQVTNEENTYKIYELDGGFEVHYFESLKVNESNIAVWYSEDMEIIFTVIGDFDFSEFEKIIKNISVNM